MVKAHKKLSHDKPKFIIIGGPNGAGKSTLASSMIPSTVTFVNADIVASFLREQGIRNTDIEAGKIILRQLDDLEAQLASFAVETTLASRGFAPRIQRLQRIGYHFHLIFVRIPTADFAVERVALRVRLGGHSVPEETIRRRFRSGLVNFMNLYMPLADTWSMYYNMFEGQTRLIAEQTSEGDRRILMREQWDEFVKEASDAQK
jgi:predicted ABC-type ATPase